MELVTPEMLAMAIDYYPDTGRLFFRHRSEAEFCSPGVAKQWNTVNAGRETFLNVTAKGYLSGRVFGCQFMAHRVAWAVYHGKWPNHQIDHINGDPADNRLANLRDVPQHINARNVKRRKDNTSGCTGVSWVKRFGKWMAFAPRGDGRSKNLGCFKTFDEAVEARAASIAGLGFTERHGEIAA
jgi:hypothetical protein